jgi:beta-glucosidase
LPSRLPKNFYFGAATSAYQIEGSTCEDGRGPSIWDTFCLKAGTILDGSSGTIACNHYKLWKQDVEFIKSLNLNSYRFSIAWTRIFPDKTSSINLKGLDFYSELIDSLLSNGIEPFPTLYHWDLPQYIQDHGGWSSRVSSLLFADYASAVYNHLQDRVKYWTTLNEPYISAFIGYLKGIHAPGIKSPIQALSAAHHLLLAHGMAMEAMRSNNKGYPLEIGITLNLSPVYPANPTDSASVEAAKWYDILHNQLFLNPLFNKEYPKEFLRYVKTNPELNEWMLKIMPGDMNVIGSSLDFLGINYYTRLVVENYPDEPIFKCKEVPQPPNQFSDMWEYYPEGLSEILDSVWTVYKPCNILILENGTSLPDELKDEMRIAYIKSHFSRVMQAIQRGIPIKGYFVWSLLDNFEWSYGYTKRFGLIHVNFETQERRLKDSAQWYAKFLTCQFP